MMLQTTSQYPLKHSETTQEEIAAPGKLPETPLRMDPDLLNEIKSEEAEDGDLGRQDQIPTESSPKQFLSYSVRRYLLTSCCLLKGKSSQRLSLPKYVLCGPH